MKQDLTGRVFSRLTVLRLIANGTKKTHEKWECLCECGATSLVARDRLLTGGTKSCGCLRREAVADDLRQRKTQHGQARRGDISGAWKSWSSMVRRCTDPRRPEYFRYGGRGIVVCERWMKFENFYADMGDRPERTSIDRYPNNDGNYEPGNCRWATKREQGRNQRTNVVICHLDQSFTLAEWAERTGLPRATLASRHRKGLLGDALFGPLQRRKSAA